MIYILPNTFHSVAQPCSVLQLASSLHPVFSQPLKPNWKKSCVSPHSTSQTFQMLLLPMSSPNNSQVCQCFWELLKNFILNVVREIINDVMGSDILLIYFSVSSTFHPPSCLDKTVNILGLQELFKVPCHQNTEILQFLYTNYFKLRYLIVTHSLRQFILFLMFFTIFLQPWN